MKKAVKRSSVVVGKLARSAAKLRGGGSALPGLVVEKLDKGFMRDALAQLPKGVAVISGTNGKTTTTKVAVELLEAQGLKVFTNRTGSNFMRGVIAALLERINLHGKLDADIAVLELDEAHALKFANAVAPDYFLALNVAEDQKDRFGGVERVAGLLRQVAEKTKECVVVNRDDELLQFGDLGGPRVGGFGAEGGQALDGAIDVSLDNYDEGRATYSMGDKSYEVQLKLTGEYNALNAAAAMALCWAVLGDKLNEAKMVKKLGQIEPAQGRGEEFVIDGQSVQLVLVKNLVGFEAALKFFAEDKHDFMIAMNNNYSDGRDASWLDDVDFSGLKKVQMVSGMLAETVAAKLKTDGIEVGRVEGDVARATRLFIESSNRPKRIFAAYTAMAVVRRVLIRMSS